MTKKQEDCRKRVRTYRGTKRGFMMSLKACIKGQKDFLVPFGVALLLIIGVSSFLIEPSQMKIAARIIASTGAILALIGRNA
ncbi:MAG: hypothetical protein PHI66_00075 [Candidatus Pacebacteria bacterium]|nr:hypothetical protein [Candidatus Paceibacterota bacterium]